MNPSVQKTDASLFQILLREPAIWVGALGYFVDLYDLVLFGAVRVASLKSLGVPENELLSTGAFLLNCQMVGLLLGGFFWGILGDKRGRVTVLYGSIFLYSMAYLANAWVTSIPAYGILRIIAGFGLAGELGGAVTLVSEVLPKRARGYGSTLIGVAGFLGAIFAASISSHFSWRFAYGSGGVLGLLLLALRMKTIDSVHFQRAKSAECRKGDLKLLLGEPALRSRFFKTILVGVPIWLVSGVMVYFAPELGADLQLTGPVTAAQAIFWCYVGSVAGDVLGGVLSQTLRSRKKVIFGYLGWLAVSMGLYCAGLRGRTPADFSVVCFLLGFGTGYWALFILACAEQFGTNLRATVATSVPNLVRGSAIVLVWLFRWLSPMTGPSRAAWFLGYACVILAVVSLIKLPETFELELDYLHE